MKEKNTVSFKFYMQSIMTWSWLIEKSVCWNNKSLFVTGLACGKPKISGDFYGQLQRKNI